jgi:HTH-like domain
MMFPLVRDLAAEAIPVRLTCGVLGFSPQAFYKWRARPCSPRVLDDAHLVNAIVDVHADDPEFGYRLITDELAAAGHTVSERRVWRLCRDHRIWSTTTKKGRRSSGKTPGQPCTTTWSSATSPHRGPTPCGSPTSPSIPGRRAQALRLRDQGLLLQPDRRLQHR